MVLLLGAEATKNADEGFRSNAPLECDGVSAPALLKSALGVTARLFINVKGSAFAEEGGVEGGASGGPAGSDGCSNTK